MSDDANQINQEIETINIVNQSLETHRNVASQLDLMNDRPSSQVTTSAFDGGVTLIAIVVGLGIVVAAILSMASSH